METDSPLSTSVTERLLMASAIEALAVHHALVFAVQPSVNEIGHTSPKRRCQLFMSRPRQRNVPAPPWAALQRP
jgi:hypothetical protein